MSATLKASLTALLRLSDNEQSSIDLKYDPPKTVPSKEEMAKAIRLIVPVPTGIELIRYGGSLDGGYLVPNDFSEIVACFSPGTNNFKRFEDELLDRHGILSYMCDFSSNESQFETPLAPGKQFFAKKWLDVDGSPDSLDINDWVASSAPTGDLLLQMDIEGAEYRNLLHASRETLDRFRIIILEIHDLQDLADRDFLDGVFNPVFGRLAESHVCAHIAANNCCGEALLADGLRVPRAVEATFIRKDRCRPTKDLLVLPHPLDELNVLRSPPIQLDPIWLENADKTMSRLQSLETSMAWMADRMVTLQLHNQFLITHAALNGNVSRTKLATLSSTAEGASDAGAAVNGTRTGRFAFHSDLEDKPWWIVDLGAVHPISHCLVFNRMDAAQRRSAGLQVSLSDDGIEWKLHYAHEGPAFGGIWPQDGEPPLVVPLHGAAARFVKLQLPGKAFLHLDQVEVFGLV